ncbi:glutamate ABC transporter substrate-binding protein [Nocardia macrotermitis]|uniref:ABC transporter glutamine-binding protein GlnH n=1 Tax=Nocardia macrotermitis TaxID=2585198 RepID=A0A7K0CZL4_9NOCA|nr:glutamate ABC transporter substrate-binding protein [Nocardia macrotermitis]MQY18926.1 ABC transporter glutamine-binding protein GlnH [Nocardia macrotermitis]
MRFTRALRLGIGVLVLTVVASGCGSGSPRTAVQDAAAGKLTVGIKFDQPGMGLQNRDGTFSGFDVDVATYVAGKLGVAPQHITFKEAPSAQRERLIQSGQVDMVVASYSITDQRKQQVDFAGPYFVAHQGLLVRADNTSIHDPNSLPTGSTLCTVAGSTTVDQVKREFPHGVKLIEYDTYSLCVEALQSRMVDAVTTDDIILAGYQARSPRLLKLLGPITLDGKPVQELYGIGLRKGDNESRNKIDDAISAMLNDPAKPWQTALSKNLGPDFPIPAPPTVNRY